MTQGNGDGPDDDELGPASGHWAPKEAGDDATAHEGLPALPPASSSPSDEQPIVVTDDSDERPRLVVGVDDSEDEGAALREEVLPEPDLPDGGQQLGPAVASLEIRTPLAELEAFARARVEGLARSGQTERAALAAEALRTAQSALKRVMGALPREVV